MPSPSTLLLKKLLFIVCSLYCLLYLVSCLTPYINPTHFWPLTFLALGFPFLLGGMLLVFLVSFFFIRKYSWVAFLILAAGYQNICSTIAFHPAHTFSTTKEAGTIRLLSWNVNQFLDSQVQWDTTGNPRRKMLKFISEMDPDILCFQDFSEFSGKGFRSTLNYIKDSLHYPYHFYSVDVRYSNNEFVQRDGVIIFSRFPLTDTAGIKFYNEDNYNESFEFADILIQHKKIRLFNAHLRSMELHSSKAQPLESDFFKPDTALLLEKNTFRKLRYFDKIHVAQAQQIKSVLDTTFIPFVFCADLNTVPAAYGYHYISNGLRDAFLENGFGLGGTYDSISPTLRIDVVLMNKLVKPVQQYTPHLHLSDHYPNVADIKIN